jgi:hypothetical protein
MSTEKKDITGAFAADRPLPKMAGLQEDDGMGGGIFLHIRGGFLCEVSKVPREGFKESTLLGNDGERYTKYVKAYKAIEALVVSMEWYKRELDNRKYLGFRLILNAAGDAISFDLPKDSTAFSRFIKTAENIDFKRPVTFKAWPDSQNHKTAFGIFQRDPKDEDKLVKVPQKYTKENLGECPPPIKDEMTDEWDFKVQTRWLLGRMAQVVIPAIQEAKNPPGRSPMGTAATQQEAEQGQHANINDLKGKNTKSEPQIPDDPSDLFGDKELSDDDIPF